MLFNAVFQLMQTLEKKVMALADTVAELEANYTTLTTAVSGVAAEVTKLSGEIATLQAQLASAGVDAATLASIQSVADGLKTQAEALNAATAAGG